MTRRSMGPHCLPSSFITVAPADEMHGSRELPQLGIDDGWGHLPQDLLLSRSTQEHTPSHQQLGIALRGEPHQAREAGAASALKLMSRGSGTTFELRSSAGPVVISGTRIGYSVHQIQQTVIAAGSRYVIRWSAENDPAAVAQGLPATLQGPGDSWVWALRATRVGVHRILATVLLNGAIIESLVYEQTVTEDGRSLLHKELIQAAAATVVQEGVTEWTIMELLAWRTPVVGDPEYIHEFKAQWVRGYREVITAAARRFDLPALLVAGVAYAEVGGDPLWIDNIAYGVRSFDHMADPVLESLTITALPDRTSFGNVSTQIRRAAEALGYDPTTLTSEQRSMIIESLEDPQENIFIAAKHLADLRDIDFRGRGASSMTLDEISVTATRFNRGPDLRLDEIMRNMSYGNSIVRRADMLLGLLE